MNINAQFSFLLAHPRIVLRETCNELVVDDIKVFFKAFPVDGRLFVACKSMLKMLHFAFCFCNAIIVEAINNASDFIEYGFQWMASTYWSNSN